MIYRAVRLWTVLLVVTFALPCSAGDWPQFRGENNSSVSTETNLPIEWKAEDAAWSVELPGRCVSGPIVSSGRVITTSSSGRQNEQLHIYCVDVSSGDVLWKRQLWAAGRTFCHPLTSMAAPTPATDGKRIYVLFASNDLVCLDFDGNVLWMRAVASSIRSRSMIEAFRRRLCWLATRSCCKSSVLVTRSPWGLRAATAAHVGVVRCPAKSIGSRRRHFL